MLRILPQALRPAEYPRRRALPGPVRRVRSSSLMTAPAPVRRMKAQDCSSSFSASPPSPPCPGDAASSASTATRPGGADSAGSSGCHQPDSPSPLSPACADCRSSVPCGTEHLAFPCLTFRLVRNPPAAGLATSLLPRARRLNSRSGHLTLSLRGIMRLRTSCEQVESGRCL